MSEEELTVHLDRLKGHLDRQEGDCVDCLEELLPELQARAPAELLEELSRAVQQYDFDEGLQRLQRLRQALGMN